MAEIPWRIWLFLVILAGGAIGLYVSLLLAVRRLRAQAPEWDAARQPALDQAMEVWQTGQGEAQALAAEYAGVGEPYATPFNQAQEAYAAALQAAEQVLLARSYPEARRIPQPTGWRLLLVAPLLSERRARQTWLPELERIQAEVQRAQTGLEAARKQAAALKDLSVQTRAEARRMLERAQANLLQITAEACPAQPFEEEKTHLEEAGARLREFLAGTGCKEDVTSAYALLISLDPILEALEQKLDTLRERRAQAEGQRENALQRLESLAAEVREEEQAGRPMPALSQSIQEWQARLVDLEVILQAGHYRPVIQASREIGARVEQAQAGLKNLKARRQQLASLALQLRAEAQETQRWLGEIPPFYQMDTSLGLLQKADTWLSGHERRTGMAESREEPEPDPPLTPDELHQARQAFDRRRQIYEEQRQKLATQTPALQIRLQAALEWLDAAHPKYQAGLSPDGLRQDEQALQAHWQAAFQQGQLRESELRQVMDHIGALVQISRRLEKNIRQAGQSRQLLLNEQEEIRQAAAHPAWTPLAAGLDKISEDGDAAFAARARAALAQLQELRASPETPGLDYGQRTRQAGQLRASLEKLNADYQSAVERTREQAKSMTEELMRLRSELLSVQNDPLLDFARSIETPVQEIEKWLGQYASLPGSSLRSLSAYRDSGERLRASARTVREGLHKSKKRYQEARKRAGSAITAAQVALANTEKTLQNAPWYQNEQSYQVFQTYQKSLAEARRIFESTGNAKQKTPIGDAIRLLEGPAYQAAQEARRKADALGQQAEAQVAQIQALRNNLAQITQLAHQRLNTVSDPKVLAHWQKVWWENASAENALRSARSFEEAVQILSEAIQRVNYFMLGINI